MELNNKVKIENKNDFDFLIINLLSLSIGNLTIHDLFRQNKQIINS